MMSIARRTLLFALVVGLAALPALAGPKITDPQQADADFALQGEYAGTIATDEGQAKEGVQVIALGKGRFRAVAYHGGLPGDGWDGNEKIEVEGSAEVGAVVFSSDGVTGRLADGKLTITAADGQLIGTLNKIERKSPTLGAKPPAGAVVLFDGTSADAFKGGRMTDDGLLMEGVTSKATFGSHRLHIEFRLPYQPEDRGQGRGNSGIYLQGRYEVQMLDSFGLAGKDNECGGVYSIADPDVNMCLPPLAWQTYDVEFTAGKYDADGKPVAHPRMTVRHNGVVVHDDLELPHSTTASPLKAGSGPGPVFLQNHGCPVRYRNIWVLPTN